MDSKERTHQRHKNKKRANYTRVSSLSTILIGILFLLSVLEFIFANPVTGFLQSNKKSQHSQGSSSTKLSSNMPPSTTETVRQEQDVQKTAHSEATINLAKKESAEHLHGMAEVYETMRKRPLRMKVYPLNDDCIDLNDESTNVKVVHFVRHGQGFHNLMADLAHEAGKKWTQFTQSPQNPYIMPEILDAPLTQKGRDQARVLQSRLNDMSVLPELVMISPTCRTLQTGTIAFQPLLANNDIPFIAHEMMREESGVHVCDQRRPKSQQASEFPMVNFDLIETEDDKLFKPDSRETKSQVSERIYTFMQWLSNREEKHIAVVSHSGWLFTVFNGICECTSEELKNWFHTGEMRSVKLVFET